MAAQKAATLIFPMLGLKTGKQAHLYFENFKKALNMYVLKKNNNQKRSQKYSK